ncbi:MAG: hypothetical protein IAG13_10205, partial [Deltaproteobacteria bacterium]|nr:hypothetical protein [Nannocystaceae bacterium]
YDAVAPQLALTEGGNAVLTAADGTVALTTSPTTLDLRATGPLVDVVNNGGAPAAASFSASNGGEVVWSLEGDEFGDAQLSAFVHVSRANAYVRGIAPALDWLDTTVTANVNIDNTCNAISDGNTLYFFRAGDCENMARLADVVYHEFGHSVHRAAIIPGVGAQSSALSEGISDYLAASMQNDSGMGRGFVFTDAPLRELDPPDLEWTWPQDKGESHMEGRIIGGTLWDLRKALRTKLGDDAGRIHTDALWYEGIRRAVDIPSMYPEALLGDDDDGDLSNGTPNVCEINAAFQAHGLLDPSELADLAVEVTAVDDGRQVRVTQALPVFEDCPVTAGDAELRWRLRDTPDEITAIAMTVEDGAWVATIPTQPTGVVAEYQVSVGYSSGSSAGLPRNQADPWYQLFFGGAEPIYCLDADADLGAWSFAGSGNTWSFGPLATGGVDPSEPYDDDGVLLSQDGIYAPNSSSSATGPMIDLTGHQDVRLQFQHWLTVEDARFDQASILGNGQQLWRNLGTDAGNVQHVDREWVFQDIPLVDALASGGVQLQLTLTTDQGLQFGGWTVDALCVVEVVESWCGDGNLGGDEECDDENNDDGDGCDATCHVEDPDPTGDDSGGSSGEDSGGDSLTSADGTGGVDDSGGSDGSSSGGAGQDGSSDGCGCDTRGRTGMLPLLAGLVVLGVRRSRRR